MLSRLDRGVRKVVKALKNDGGWENTLLVFITDNGEAIMRAGSNYPLRGTKSTLFEGGTHGVGFVTGGFLSRSGEIISSLMHITDWYPTLFSAAGHRLTEETETDGVDQWDVIRGKNTSKRTEVVYNLKMILSPMGDIRLESYKLMFGKNFKKDGWYNIDGILNGKTRSTFLNY